MISNIQKQEERGHGGNFAVKQRNRVIEVAASGSKVQMFSQGPPLKEGLPTLGPRVSDDNIDAEEARRLFRDKGAMLEALTDQIKITDKAAVKFSNCWHMSHNVFFRGGLDKGAGGGGPHALGRQVSQGRYGGLH